MLLTFCLKMQINHISFPSKQSDRIKTQILLSKITYENEFVLLTDLNRYL